MNLFFSFTNTVAVTLVRSFFVLLILPFAVMLPIAFAGKPDYAYLHAEYARCDWKEIASAEEKAKVFHLLYDSCDSNYKKIITWQATCQRNDYASEPYSFTIDQQSIQDKSFEKSFRSRAEFSLDLRADKVNWKIQTNPDDFTKTSDSTDGFNSPVKPVRHKLTQEELTSQYIGLPNIKYIRPSFKLMSGPVQNIPEYNISERIVISAAPSRLMRPSPFSTESFDPRYFLCSMLDGYEKWNTYCHLYGKIAAILEGVDEHPVKKLYHVYQANYNDEVLYKVSFFHEGEYPIEEQIFSSAVGFSIVSKKQYSEKDIAVSSWGWQYTEENGIFVPKVFSTCFLAGGAFTEYILQQSRVNAELPKDIFEIPALGVRDDDIIINHQEKKNYIFRNGKMEFLCNFGETPSIETIQIKNGYSFTQILCMLCGVFLILTGLGLKIFSR